MRKRNLPRAIELAVVTCMAPALHAQQNEPAGRELDHFVELNEEPTADVIPLEAWNYDELYAGWSADAVLDTRVTGTHGTEIGEVENLLIDGTGQIVALIAEVGGLWEIGDTHVAIPWDEVSRSDDAVQIPITEETISDYSLFKEDFFSKVDEGDIDGVTEDVRTGPRIWKATELLDDYMVIEAGEPYGYVTDLVFDDSGNLRSVVASASNAELGDAGVYAYPWYGYDYGWRPELDRYSVPYTTEQIAGLSVFDYEELGAD